MTKKFLFVVAILASGIIQAQNSTVHYTNDPYEVRFIRNGQITPDLNKQQVFAQSEAWQNFKSENGMWNAHFNEVTAIPHRAFGQPISVNGNTTLEVAQNFISEQLSGFDIDLENLEHTVTTFNGKHSWVFFQQLHEGHPILFDDVVVKVTTQNEVIMFGADYHEVSNLDLSPALTSQDAIEIAEDEFENIEFSFVQPDLKILPIETNGYYNYHLVYEAVVRFMGDHSMPSEYYTIVDAHTGEILYRQNKVHACGPECSDDHSELSAVNVHVTGTGHLEDASIDPIALNMANIEVNINGSVYNTDDQGMLQTSETGPVDATVTLQGLYSQIVNNTTNDTPSLTVTLNEGGNLVVVDSDANINEISAYHSVNVIHDYMKIYLPGFTGLDNQLTTNVDINEQTCNAFWDGSSINFYVDNNSGQCVALSKVADVVFHEYGHGINGRFYQSLGASFSNGGMNEGYADVWGFGPNEDPILGDGHNPQNWDDWIRRYDQEPKVYPQDLVGQVHADGEIIAGAWWDLYENFGNDIDATMELFALAFPGLQATAPNGQEGQAFVDVLIDALQADDDDNDLNNGTPNSVAIAEAFAEHGISLIASAELDHDELMFGQVDEGILIEAELDIQFDLLGYVDAVNLAYRMNEETVWTDVEMINTNGDNYEYELPAQPAGTIIYYYLYVSDATGAVSAVTPQSADKMVNANLPYNILIGYEAGESHDSDDNSDWGDWTLGLPTDNATTGEWEENVPIGSDGGTVAPGTQNTPGGELCFLTGQSFGPNNGIGENDVDGGTTTLVSPVIDLTGYDNPTFTYYRWYINNPPTGANPNQDWFQGYVSDDGGDNWVELDITKASDNSWRRNAFRVQDYVNATSEFMMKFHASDSVFPNSGLNFDGGSLVEAAIDDIVLWDNAPTGINENVLEVDLNIFPNPASDILNVNIKLESTEKLDLEILNHLGQIISRRNLGAFYGQKQVEMDITQFAKGNYKLRLISGAQTYTESFTKL